MPRRPSDTALKAGRLAGTAAEPLACPDLPAISQPVHRGIHMKNGKCKQCGSSSVYSKPDGIGLGDSRGVLVYVSMMTQRSPVVAYVCTTCGYFENHIADPKKLADVAKNWPKVPA
jgi:hypothetical protein